MKIKPENEICSLITLMSVISGLFHTIDTFTGVVFLFFVLVTHGVKLAVKTQKTCTPGPAVTQIPFLIIFHNSHQFCFV